MEIKLIKEEQVIKTRREFVKLVGGAAVGTAAMLTAGPVGKAIAAPA